MDAVGQHHSVEEEVDVRVAEMLQHCDLARRELHVHALVLLLAERLDRHLLLRQAVHCHVHLAEEAATQRAAVFVEAHVLSLADDLLARLERARADHLGNVAGLLSAGGGAIGQHHPVHLNRGSEEAAVLVLALHRAREGDELLSRVHAVQLAEAVLDECRDVLVRQLLRGVAEEEAELLRGRDNGSARRDLRQGHEVVHGSYHSAVALH
mmetsp:Transcript_3419/g.12016  ORF Transcript_3419/g.12016 Transcript_3419/m.12016 type:complete len:210 (+) Transcript_3419:890-1519(+)